MYVKLFTEAIIIRKNGLS